VTNRSRGVKCGSIYSSHLKRAIGEIFHRTSLVRTSNKSGGPLWKLVESFWKPVPYRTSPVHWTSLVAPPNKSNKGLWKPISASISQFSGQLWFTGLVRWLHRTSPVKASRSWWIHQTSPVKPKNRRFGRLSTSTSHQTFSMRPS
jgi:hypothetical protein